MKFKFIISSFITLIIFSYMKAGVIYDSPGTIIKETGTLSIGSYDVLQINKGTVLHLTGTVTLGTNARIIIQPGAMLYLDGGILTNTTNDESEFWSGIEIVGSDKKIDGSQYFLPTKEWVSANYSGLDFGLFVSTNDAYIKYSHYGVMTSTAFVTGPTTGHAGGYFKISSTHFYNNLFSSVFINTAPGLNGIGYTIKKSEFITDFASGKPFDEPQIKLMDGVSSLQIDHCVFKALRASINKAEAIMASTNIYISNCVIENFKSSIRILNQNLSSNSGYRHSSVDQTTIVHPYNTPYPCVIISNSDNVRFFDNTITCALNTNGKPNPIINVNGSDNVNIFQISVSYTNGYSPGTVANAIYLRNTMPFKGLLARSEFHDMDDVIFSEGNNLGFVFTCNKIYDTKGNDLMIYSGNIAPIQGTLNYPAENYFLPSPNLPTSRFNLNTRTNNQMTYWWNSIEQNTDPLKSATPVINPIGSTVSKNKIYNCCAICLVKPNGNSETDHSGIDQLNLSVIERDRLIRNIDIRNTVYAISDFSEKNQMDSAIGLVENDTSFFGLYYHSKLLLAIDSVDAALKLIKNAPVNNNPEMINFKSLFPIICKRFNAKNDSAWFAQHRDSIYAIASRGEGFISEQAGAIIDQYTQFSHSQNSSSYYFIQCQIFPNPFSNTINIEIKDIASTIDSLEILLLDLNGNEKLKTKVGLTVNNPQTIQLNTDNIATGLYTLILQHQAYVIKYVYISK